MERRTSASRRIANVLLSVVLVLGLMPAPALAEGGIGADDSNGCESLSEVGDVSASMEPGTTAKAFDIDAAPASDGPSALSEGGASLTPGWTQSGTCEWKIDGDGLLTVRPLGDGASGELADWGGVYAPWCSQGGSIKSAVIRSGVSARTCHGMFSDCSSLTSLDLSPLDTSKVGDMGWMFYNCSSLTSLDLSPLNTSAVQGMYSMFSGCSSLTSLTCRPWTPPRWGTWAGCSTTARCSPPSTPPPASTPVR